MSKLIIEVCKIELVEALYNADKMEMVQVKGWHCLVSKGTYKSGDLCIYVPPDSVIPIELIEKYKLEFLRHNNRIGTIKLRGYISEGLVLSAEGYKLGQDVSKLLGITKYEPPTPDYQAQHKKETIKSLFLEFYNKDLTLKRFIKKSIVLLFFRKKSKTKRNPCFDVYTDIENIKNHHTVFESTDEVIVSEKIHGTNTRFGWMPKPQKTIIEKINYVLSKDKYEFCYGSHRVQLDCKLNKQGFYKKDVYGEMVKTLHLKEILPKGLLFYGEIYGKKIQNLEYGLSDIAVVFYDIKNVHTGKYLPYSECYKIFQDLKLPTVPILYKGLYSDSILKQCTEGFSVLYPSAIKEGCVVKDINEKYHPQIGRKILKSINPAYLLLKNRSDFH